jgi:universal stress protein A
MRSIRKILVPVDFSDSARRALEYAVTLADRLGASIDVLHAWDIPGYLRPDLTVWAGDVSGSLAEHARRDAQENMVQFLDQAGLTTRPDLTSHVISGTPYATILAAIEEGKYDLVVMGTHGRTGISHALIGSVAERVVRHSPCPVLTVRGAA